MLEMHLITDSLVYPFPYNYKHVAPKIRCSQMQFNRVNNKEHQRSLVYSAVLCTCICLGILCALRFRHSCLCFEHELVAF